MQIPGMGNMLKQVQKMQEDMKKKEQELAEKEFVGKAGGDLAEVTLDGHKNCKKVKLDPSLMSEDKEVVEDLIAAAFNDACRKVDSAKESSMGDLTAGLKLPPGMDSFFK